MTTKTQEQIRDRVAVGAIDDHVILAVGAPHKPVDSAERMTPVEYVEVLADVHDMHCLICDIEVVGSDRLHDTDCGHCPCGECPDGHGFKVA